MSCVEIDQPGPLRAVSANGVRLTPQNFAEAIRARRDRRPARDEDGRPWTWC